MDGMKNNRNAALCAASFALVALAWTTSFSDDVVGVMSVDVGTNGVAEVEMPFSPLSPDLGPRGYVAGDFLGDGGELSDTLVRFDAVSGTSTNAVWGVGGWLDPATGISSLMAVSPGDTLFLLLIDMGAREPQTGRLKWNVGREGRYRLSDAATGRAIPNGDSETWTSTDLARGIPVTVNPQERLLLRLDAGKQP